MGLFTTKDTEDENASDVFHFPTSKKLLLIFTRNPQLGKCKTRLAAKIGAENALDIYKFLLQHTVAITQDSTPNKRVYYSEEIWEEDIWNPKFYTKMLQKGNDLGERMKHAFEEGFRDGYEKIIIIGSDIYDLSQQDIEAAFLALEDHDFVIGPAKDGGYYLLGMKTLKPKLFQNKEWGTTTVLEDTLQDLSNETVCHLPLKNDIDVLEDILDIEVFQPYLKQIKNDS